MDTNGLPQYEIENRAVAYAISHESEVPENVRKFIKDLYEYEESGKRLQKAHRDATAAIEKIEKQMSQLFGSIDAVVRIIARELGPEKITEFSGKFAPKTEPKIQEEKCEEPMSKSE